uniref:Uncharacterized protein n=1 Tax=Globodera rostochiensis TaxID=31243 RepID=A0A914H2V7_GLORO
MCIFSNRSMAVLPSAQLLSWSSARLLALLLNALNGLFQHLEKGDISRGKAVVDWDTPLGLRLIKESLLAMDRNLQERGFHPAIFSAIRNLSVQSDLLLKEKIDQTRTRDPELFGKLAPLFIVRTRAELAEHKLVDEGLRWSDKEQSSRKAGEEEEQKRTKEELWIKEKPIGVGMGCLLSSMHRNCEISRECAEFLTATGKIGTVLSHQLFLMLLIDDQFRKCPQHINNISSNFQSPFSVDDRPNLTALLAGEKCANIFDELNVWTVPKNRKKLARINVGTLALLTEQVFLCGHQGFIQFANPHLLVTLLSWQHPKLGCWTARKPDSMTNLGIHEAVEFEQFRGMSAGRRKNAEVERAEEMSSREDAFCLPHMSTVAGLAISSVYLRFLLDPGPWPEHSLTEQLVQMDGVLAEDKFRQFPYLEWVRDSLIEGVEPIGIQLLRPPSSSWSPDLIAFIFLLFLVVFAFVLIMHFCGDVGEHPTGRRAGALQKKMYPYAFKKRARRRNAMD